MLTLERVVDLCMEIELDDIVFEGINALAVIKHYLRRKTVGHGVANSLKASKFSSERDEWKICSKRRQQCSCKQALPYTLELICLEDGPKVIMPCIKRSI